MDNVFKILMIAVIAVVTTGFIKERAPEFAAVCIIAFIVMFIAAIIPEIKEIWNKISYFWGRSETQSLIAPVVKVLAITTLMKIISDMCADAGEKAIGHMTEIIGAICALTAIIPLITELIDNVGRLI